MKNWEVGKKREKEDKEGKKKETTNFWRVLVLFKRTIPKAVIPTMIPMAAPPEIPLFREGEIRKGCSRT